MLEDIGALREATQKRDLYVQRQAQLFAEHTIERVCEYHANFKREGKWYLAVMFFDTEADLRFDGVNFMQKFLLSKREPTGVCKDCLVFLIDKEKSGPIFLAEYSDR